MFSLEKCAFRNLFFPFLFNNSLQILFTQTKKKKKKKQCAVFFLRATTFVASVIPPHMLHNQADPHHSTTRKRRKHAISPRLVNTEHTTQGWPECIESNVAIAGNYQQKENIVNTAMTKRSSKSSENALPLLDTHTQNTTKRVNI